MLVSRGSDLNEYQSVKIRAHARPQIRRSRVIMAAHMHIVVRLVHDCATGDGTGKRSSRVREYARV
jgi:hypothetical protein